MRIRLGPNWTEWLVVAGLLFFGACVFIYARRGASAPQIICDSPSVDLGVIKNEEPIDCLFTIRNSGRAVLEIASVKTSCACTVVPFYQTSLKAGESTVMPVRMDVKDRQGKMKQYVLLTTNDPAQPQFPLRLTADVEIDRTATVIGAMK